MEFETITLTVKKDIVINKIEYKQGEKLLFTGEVLNSSFEDKDGNHHKICLHTLNIEYDGRLKDYLSRSELKAVQYE